MASSLDESESAPVKSIKTMITESYGLTIGNLLDDTKAAKNSFLDIIKTTQVMGE